MSQVMCNYCKATAALVTGATIYPHRPDLHEKFFYLCPPCSAYVGCHPGTTNALGRLANEELRIAKTRAHAAFDPIWKSRQMKRGSAYKWLAGELGIHPNDCHIGMFSIETCNQVIEICQKRIKAG